MGNAASSSCGQQTLWKVRFIMSERPFKPKEYFEKLLTIPEQEIDYTESPSTKTADREGAEVLFPITPEEFRAFREFIRDRRDKVEMLIAKPDGEKIKKIAILGEQFPDKPYAFASGEINML